MMKSWRFGVVLLLCLGVTSLALATPIATPSSGASNGSLPTVAVGSLPACTSGLAGRQYWVTGLASTSACSGTGSAAAACLCSGSSWAPIGSGGASSNSFATISTTSGTAPVASSPTDTLALSAGAGITVTGNSGAKSATIAATLGVAVDPGEMANANFGGFTCASGVCTDNAGAITSAMLAGSIDPLKLSPGTVTSAELGYVHNVTSAIQTQLNGKLATAGGSMTGTVTFDGTHGITGLPVSSAASDAVTRQELIPGTTFLDRAGTQAPTANIPFAGFKATGLGAGSWASTDAARMADLALCADPTVCAQVVDTNGDGDIAPELQKAINALLWPSGTLTSASDVYLVAPPKKQYNLASPVVICGDTSPPSGGSSTPPDCTGTQQLPRIHFVGAWSSSKLLCTITPTNVVNNLTPCLKIGDAYADGFGYKVPLEFDTPVWIAQGVSSTFTNAQMNLWCDGCTGQLRARLEANPPVNVVIWPGPAAVIAGGGLNSRIEATGNSAGTVGAAVFMDGEQTDSAISYRGTYASLNIGSYLSSSNQYWAPVDGCDYGSFTGHCDNLRILSDTNVQANSSVASMEISDGDNLLVEGSYTGAAGQQKPVLDVKEYGSGARVLYVKKMRFNGRCDLPSSDYNNCIRILGDPAGNPPVTPFIFVDGTFRSAIAANDLDKGFVGCGGQLSTRMNTQIVLGAGVNGENTAGGYAGVFSGAPSGKSWSDPCDLTSALQEVVRVRSVAQTLGGAPYCVDLRDGTYRSCSDARTKYTPIGTSKRWAFYNVTARLNGNAASSTSCNLVVKKNGTTVIGSGPTHPGDAARFFPSGNPIIVGGQSFKTSGTETSWNIASDLASTDYAQLVLDSDYSNLGNSLGCLATSDSGTGSAAATNTFTDSTKSWTTNQWAGYRLVIDTGVGGAQVRTIASNTGTVLTLNASPAWTVLPNDFTVLVPQYRIVSGSGSCACASEALPEIDFRFSTFKTN